MYIQDFGGLDIGVFFLEPQVNEVRTVDETMVVSDARSNQARVILEGHDFLRTGTSNRTGREVALGPFVAESLADDQRRGLLNLSLDLESCVGFALKTPPIVGISGLDGL